MFLGVLFTCSLSPEFNMSCKSLLRFNLPIIFPLSGSGFCLGILVCVYWSYRGVPPPPGPIGLHHLKIKWYWGKKQLMTILEPVDTMVWILNGNAMYRNHVFKAESQSPAYMTKRPKNKTMFTTCYIIAQYINIFLSTLEHAKQMNTMQDLPQAYREFVTFIYWRRTNL